jgi:hypothetical protein
LKIDILAGSFIFQTMCKLASFLSGYIKQIIMAITKESIRVEGEKVLNKVKELVKEGNVRKITIHDKDGKELMSFPLSIGVVGAVFAPVLAAVGALAALIGECSITVEREEKAVEKEEKV